MRRAPPPPPAPHPSPKCGQRGGQPGNNFPMHRARVAPGLEFLPKPLGENLKAGAWTHPFLPGHLLSQARLATLAAARLLPSALCLVKKLSAALQSQCHAPWIEWNSGSGSLLNPKATSSLHLPSARLPSNPPANTIKRTHSPV